MVHNTLCLSLVRMLLVAIVTAAANGAGQTGFDVYRFPKGGASGSHPYASLTPDADSNLYGTTQFGGSGSCVNFEGTKIGCGTVFRLTPPVTVGGAWTETVLYSFQGIDDGQSPFGGVIFDGSGNLYGTTQYGGSVYGGGGTVFKLSPPQPGENKWTQETLYRFPQIGDVPASTPSGNLVLDATGNIYGATGRNQEGNDECSVTCGAIFQLSPPSAQGKWWRLKLLHGFIANDGEGPTGGLIMGGSGVLYGTTTAGGNGTGYLCWQITSPDGCGAVFQVVPPAHAGEPWTESVIYSPNGPPDDGMSPSAGLVSDSSGNLYGVNSTGGIGTCFGFDPGCGTVFQLIPPTTSGGAWTENLLYEFQGGVDGGVPMGAFIVDPEGNLYGTTQEGGILPCALVTVGCGTVFKLSPPAVSGGSWSKTTIHEFTGVDGQFPEAGLLFSNGALYGTTGYGGYKCPAWSSGAPPTCGVVFKVVP